MAQQLRRMKLGFRYLHRDGKFHYLSLKLNSQQLADLKSMSISELLEGRENMN